MRLFYFLVVLTRRVSLFEKESATKISVVRFNLRDAFVLETASKFSGNSSALVQVEFNISPLFIKGAQ